MLDALRSLAFLAMLLGVAQPGASPASTIPVITGHAHDFDFEFGSWHARLRRLRHPLSGSREWIAYEGTSVVHRLWNGRGDIGEFDVHGPSGNILGSSLRLFDPQTRQWNVYWANANDGTLTVPLSGGFNNGTGLFYGRDSLNGRPIVARFIISHLTPHSFQLEQAFSPDDGATWETNWIANFTK